MKRIIVSAALVGSVISLSSNNTVSIKHTKDSISCAKNLVEIEKLGFIDKELPVGLYSNKSFGINLGLQIYANSEDELGMFRTVDNFAKHSTIALCKNDDRHFIKTDSGKYYEFYKEDDILYLTTDATDPNSSKRVKFERMNPAKILAGY